jgi:hypothetical protein
VSDCHTAALAAAADPAWRGGILNIRAALTIKPLILAGSKGIVRSDSLRRDVARNTDDFADCGGSTGSGGDCLVNCIRERARGCDALVEHHTCHMVIR